MAQEAYLEPPLRIVALGDRQIAIRVAGEGDRLPLVLLHGIGSNSSAWAGQFAGFASDRLTVAWNAPGYAESSPLPMPIPGPEDYAASLLVLLDALEIGRALLVGQSLGAIMATAAALLQPQRIAGLVLASPASGYAIARGENLPAAVAARIEEVEHYGPRGLADRRAHRLLTQRASPEAKAIVHRTMAQVTVDGYRQASHMLAHADLAAMAAQLALPTLTLWGEEDIITLPAACARIADAVPRGRSTALPRLGHGCATEAPSIFNAALANFFDALV